MPNWLILAVLGTIAITALLMWVLWRINAPGLAEAENGNKTDPESPPGS